MKRIFTLGVCLLMAAALLCGCDQKPGNDVSVDVNAPIHTLDEFRHGDVSCLVTLKDLTEKPTDTSEKSKENSAGSAVGNEMYQLKGQAAVDVYNLMKRGEWIDLKQATATDAESRPAVVNTTLVTLDFYSGRSMENAREYFGTFQFSELDMVFISANPFTTNISAMVMPVGTFDSIMDYVQEKGEKIK